MCLGIPGRIIALSVNDGLPMGVVDFGGIRKEVCLAYVPESKVGDYVVIHVGFAISRLDEDEALRTLEIIAAIPGAMAQELSIAPPNGSAA